MFRYGLGTRCRVDMSEGDTCSMETMRPSPKIELGEVKHVHFVDSRDLL